MRRPWGEALRPCERLKSNRADSGGGPHPTASGSAQWLLHCSALDSQEGLQLVDTPERAGVASWASLVYQGRCDGARMRQVGAGGRNASKAEVLGSQGNLLEETPGYVA